MNMTNKRFKFIIGIDGRGGIKANQSKATSRKPKKNSFVTPMFHPSPLQILPPNFAEFFLVPCSWSACNPEIQQNPVNKTNSPELPLSTYTTEQNTNKTSPRRSSRYRS